MGTTSHPMQELKVELQKILNLVPKNSKIIYADYPLHENVGDLLIMKGTEAFFRDNQIQVMGRYNCVNFPRGKKFPKDWIIVCHGGGNFGDLYLNHHEQREFIVQNYPENKIVIFPQTVFFQNEISLERTVSIFNKHKNLHLFARDKRSYDFVKKHFSINVYLSPDMAHQLWPIKSIGEPKKELLNFIRTDDESNDKSNHNDKNGDVLDWPVLLDKLDHTIVKNFVRFSKIDSKMFNTLPLWFLWNHYTDYLVNKSIKVYSQYKHVNTSRLHGHILSCLLNKNNTVLDNSYGKNSNYYLNWTCKVNNSTLKDNA